MEVVATASTVEAAMAAAVRQPPEVLVLDPELGAQDGLQLLDRLHNAGLHPATVALAATDELTAVQLALGAGAHSYVAKHVRYPAVIDAIRRNVYRTLGPGRPAPKRRGDTGAAVRDGLAGSGGSVACGRGRDADWLTLPQVGQNLAWPQGQQRWLGVAIWLGHLGGAGDR